MKASAPSMSASQTAEKASWMGYFELTKPRLTALVLVTTLVGLYVGAQESISCVLMLNTLIGTALVAGGAAALNQLLEREHDAKMRRTEARPLPSGRLQPEAVLVFGGVCSAVGLIYLAAAVNLLTSVLGAITLVSYLFVYTPLKRVTPLNTVIGAIPGALPPLMGWTAVRGEVTGEGWALFGILFFWQLPHFLAIGWIYREEYAKAGFAMLPVIDVEGSRTGRQAVSHTLGLLTVSLAPFVFKLAGVLYLAGALGLGMAFIWFAIQFSRHLTKWHARQLFYTSIIYLPLLLGLMVLDKVK
ncbi:MAG: protoheme IX farnesyltransferase [Verrucomicrobia bacterium]|nr:protoheme IX farnesyltransferase [Verrucomicrobiota bacterium]